MKNLTYLLLSILIVPLLISCPGAPDGTEIQYSTTVNVLTQGSFPLPDEYRDMSIQGFILGLDLLGGPVLRTSSAEISNWILPAAGAELAFCNDGEVQTRRPVGELLRGISLIGDTGNEDVSDDTDCHCDSRIDNILFNRLEIVFSEFESIGFDNLQISGDILCPNSAQGHHIAGDREFDGEVDASISVTLRVLPDNSALVADITLHMIEV
jgi:hypothetical protein